MILSINQELRLHIPSNAVDDVTLLSGIIDNSEKDFLKEKLGSKLYSRLCEYYNSIDALSFCNKVIDGTYTQEPWAELLLNAQRMVCNDALARFAYQQVISVNGSGINVVSGNDYGNADDRLLDKGVGGYKKEAAIACNNLLILLEGWAKQVDEGINDDVDDTAEPTPIDVIVSLWRQSKYYYTHADLLIPTAVVLQEYIDIYENRDKFIRLLPDLRFIQDEYIVEAFGEDFVETLLGGSIKWDDNSDALWDGGNTITVESTPFHRDNRMIRKVRRLMVAYLEQRTTVLAIDKIRRQQAHDEAISLKENILSIIKAKEQSQSTATAHNATVPEDSSSVKTGYKNNQQGSRIFVSPLLY